MIHQKDIEMFFLELLKKNLYILVAYPFFWG